MGHDKTRSSVSIGEVDWSDPHLNDLLQKVDGWNIEQRSGQSPRQVQIRVACDWNASDISKPAQLLCELDGTMILATSVPLPHGGDVGVNALPGGNSQTRWGVVVEEREGRRAGDRERSVYLNWLRPR